MLSYLLRVHHVLIILTSHVLLQVEDYSEELLTSHEKLKVQLIDDLSDKKALLQLLNKYFTLLQEAHELEVGLHPVPAIPR